jgi:protein tyrosine/serine phosphatase
MGVKTVINLRGEDAFAHYLFEKESCEKLGLTLVNRKLWARSAAPRENIVAVIDALREAEKPLILHCKSGADRAGFVSAMYLMVFEDVPVETAMKQLSIKYIHLKHTKTGLQGYILRVYQARLALGEISFEDWIRQEYIPGILQTGWDPRRVERETAQELMTKALG